MMIDNGENSTQYISEPLPVFDKETHTLKQEKFTGEDFLARSHLVGQLCDAILSSDLNESLSSLETHLAKVYPEEWQSIIASYAYDFETAEADKSGWTFVSDHPPSNGKDFYFVHKMSVAIIYLRQNSDLLMKLDNPDERLLHGLKTSSFVTADFSADDYKRFFNERFDYYIKAKHGKANEPTGGISLFSDYIYRLTDSALADRQLHEQVIKWILDNDLLQKPDVKSLRETLDSQIILQQELQNLIKEKGFWEDIVGANEQHVLNDAIINIPKLLSLSIDLGLDKKQILSIFACFEPAMFGKIALTLNAIQEKKIDAAASELLEGIDI